MIIVFHTCCLSSVEASYLFHLDDGLSQVLHPCSFRRSPTNIQHFICQDFASFGLWELLQQLQDDLEFSPHKMILKILAWNRILKLRLDNVVCPILLCHASLHHLVQFGHHLLCLYDGGNHHPQSTPALS